MLNLAQIYQPAIIKELVVRPGGGWQRRFNATQVLETPANVEATATALAAPLAGLGAVTVMGIAYGGLLIGAAVARHLNLRFIYAEKRDPSLVLRRFEILRGEKIILIDDTCKTGHRLREAAQIIRERGGEIVGIGVIADVHSGQQFPVPFVKLFEL